MKNVVTLNRISNTRLTYDTLLRQAASQRIPFTVMDSIVVVYIMESKSPLQSRRCQYSIDLRKATRLPSSDYQPTTLQDALLNPLFPSLASYSARISTPLHTLISTRKSYLSTSRQLLETLPYLTKT